MNWSPDLAELNTRFGTNGAQIVHEEVGTGSGEKDKKYGTREENCQAEMDGLSPKIGEMRGKKQQEQIRRSVQIVRSTHPAQRWNPSRTVQWLAPLPLPRLQVDRRTR